MLQTVFVIIFVQQLYQPPEQQLIDNKTIIGFPQHKYNSSCAQ